MSLATTLEPGLAIAAETLGKEAAILAEEAKVMLAQVEKPKLLRRILNWMKGKPTETIATSLGTIEHVDHTGTLALVTRHAETGVLESATLVRPGYASPKSQVKSLKKMANEITWESRKAEFAAQTTTGERMFGGASIGNDYTAAARDGVVEQMRREVKFVAKPQAVPHDIEKALIGHGVVKKPGTRLAQATKTIETGTAEETTHWRTHAAHTKQTGPHSL